MAYGVEEIIIEAIHFTGDISDAVCQKLLQENVSKEKWCKTCGYMYDDYGRYRTFTSGSGLEFWVYEIPLDRWNHAKIIKMVQPGVVPNVVIEQKLPEYIKMQVLNDDPVTAIIFSYLQNHHQDLPVIDIFLKKIATGFAWKRDNWLLNEKQKAEYYISSMLTAEEIKKEFLKNRIKIVR